MFVLNNKMKKKRTFIAQFLILIVLTMPVAFAQSVKSPDFNDDGEVTFDDYFMFANAYGTKAGDANWDTKYDIEEKEPSKGAVDIQDFFKFAEYFGKPWKKITAPAGEPQRTVVVEKEVCLDLNLDNIIDEQDKPIIEQCSKKDTDVADLCEAAGITDEVDANALFEKQRGTLTACSVDLAGGVSNTQSMGFLDDMRDDLCPLPNCYAEDAHQCIEVGHSYVMNGSSVMASCINGAFYYGVIGQKCRTESYCKKDDVSIRNSQGNDVYIYKTGQFRLPLTINNKVVEEKTIIEMKERLGYCEPLKNNQTGAVIEGTGIVISDKTSDAEWKRITDIAKTIRAPFTRVAEADVEYTHEDDSVYYVEFQSDKKEDYMGMCFGVFNFVPYQCGAPTIVNSCEFPKEGIGPKYPQPDYNSQPNFNYKKNPPSVSAYQVRSREGKFVGEVKVTGKRGEGEQVQLQVAPGGRNYYDIISIIQTTREIPSTAVSNPQGELEFDIDLEQQFSDAALCYNDKGERVEGCLADDMQYFARARLLDAAGRPISVWYVDTSLRGEHQFGIATPYIETMRQIEQDVKACNDFRWTTPDVIPTIIPEDDLGIVNDVKWRFKENQLKEKYYFQVQYSNDMKFWLDVPAGEKIDPSDPDFNVIEDVFRPHDWLEVNKPEESSDLYRISSVGEVRYHRSKWPIKKNRIFHLGSEKCTITPTTTETRCSPVNDPVTKEPIPYTGTRISFTTQEDIDFFNQKIIDISTTLAADKDKKQKLFDQGLENLLIEPNFRQEEYVRIYQGMCYGKEEDVVIKPEKPLDFNNCLPEGVYVYRVRAVNEDGYPLSSWGYSDYILLSYKHFEQTQPLLFGVDGNLVKELIDSRKVAASYTDTELKETYSPEEIDETNIRRLVLAYDISGKYNLGSFVDPNKGVVKEGCSGVKVGLKFTAKVAIVVATTYASGPLSSITNPYLKGTLTVMNAYAGSQARSALGADIGKAFCGRSASCIQIFTQAAAAADFSGGAAAGKSKVSNYFKTVAVSEATRRLSPFFGKICPIKSGVGGQLCGLARDFGTKQVVSMIGGSAPSKKQFVNSVKSTLRNYAISETGKAVCQAKGLSSVAEKPLVGQQICRLVGEIVYDTVSNSVKSAKIKFDAKQAAKQATGLGEQTAQTTNPRAYSWVKFFITTGPETILRMPLNAVRKIWQGISYLPNLPRDVKSAFDKDPNISPEMRDKLGNALRSCAEDVAFEKLMEQLSKFSVPIGSLQDIPSQHFQALRASVTQNLDAYEATLPKDPKTGQLLVTNPYYEAYKRLNEITADRRVSFAEIQPDKAKANGCRQLKEASRKAAEALGDQLKQQRGVYYDFSIAPIMDKMLKDLREDPKITGEIRQFVLPFFDFDASLGDEVENAFKIYTSWRHLLSAPEADQVKREFYALALYHIYWHMKSGLECWEDDKDASPYEVEKRAFQKTWQASEVLSANFKMVRELDYAAREKCLGFSQKGLINKEECVGMFLLARASGYTGQGEADLFRQLLQSSPIYRVNLDSKISCHGANFDFEYQYINTQEYDDLMGNNLMTESCDIRDAPKQAGAGGTTTFAVFDVKSAQGMGGITGYQTATPSGQQQQGSDYIELNNMKMKKFCTACLDLASQRKASCKPDPLVPDKLTNILVSYSCQGKEEVKVETNCESLGKRCGKDVNGEAACVSMAIVSIVITEKTFEEIAQLALGDCKFPGTSGVIVDVNNAINNLITGYQTATSKPCLLPSKNGIPTLVTRLVLAMQEKGVDVTNENFENSLKAVLKKNPQWGQFKDEIMSYFKATGYCKDGLVLLKDNKETDCYQNNGLCIENNCVSFDKFGWNADILNAVKGLSPDNDFGKRIEALDSLKGKVKSNLDLSRKIYPILIRMLSENPANSNDFVIGAALGTLLEIGTTHLDLSSDIVLGITRAHIKDTLKLDRAHVDIKEIIRFELNSNNKGIAKVIDSLLIDLGNPNKEETASEGLHTVLTTLNEEGSKSPAKIKSLAPSLLNALNKDKKHTILINNLLTIIYNFDKSSFSDFELVLKYTSTSKGLHFGQLVTSVPLENLKGITSKQKLGEVIGTAFSSADYTFDNNQRELAVQQLILIQNIHEIELGKDQTDIIREGIVSKLDFKTMYLFTAVDGEWEINDITSTFEKIYKKISAYIKTMPSEIEKADKDKKALDWFIMDFVRRARLSELLINTDNPKFFIDRFENILKTYHGKFELEKFSNIFDSISKEPKLSPYKPIAEDALINSFNYYKGKGENDAIKKISFLIQYTYPGLFANRKSEAENIIKGLAPLPQFDVPIDAWLNDQKIKAKFLFTSPDDKLEVSWFYNTVSFFDNNGFDVVKINGKSVGRSSLTPRASYSKSRNVVLTNDKQPTEIEMKLQAVSEDGITEADLKDVIDTFSDSTIDLIANRGHSSETENFCPINNPLFNEKVNMATPKLLYIGSCFSYGIAPDIQKKFPKAFIIADSSTGEGDVNNRALACTIDKLHKRLGTWKGIEDACQKEYPILAGRDLVFPDDPVFQYAVYSAKSGDGTQLGLGQSNDKTFEEIAQLSLGSCALPGTSGVIIDVKNALRNLITGYQTAQPKDDKTCLLPIPANYPVLADRVVVQLRSRNIQTTLKNYETVTININKLNQGWDKDKLKNALIKAKLSPSEVKALEAYEYITGVLSSMSADVIIKNDVRSKLNPDLGELRNLAKAAALESPNLFNLNLLSLSLELERSIGFADYQLAVAEKAGLDLLPDAAAAADAKISPKKAAYENALSAHEDIYRQVISKADYSGDIVFGIRARSYLARMLERSGMPDSFAKAKILMNEVKGRVASLRTLETPKTTLTSEHISQINSAYRAYSENYLRSQTLPLLATQFQRVFGEEDARKTALKTREDLFTPPNLQQLQSQAGNDPSLFQFYMTLDTANRAFNTFSLYGQYKQLYYNFAANKARYECQTEVNNEIEMAKLYLANALLARLFGVTEFSKQGDYATARIDPDKTIAYTISDALAALKVKSISLKDASQAIGFDTKFQPNTYDIPDIAEFGSLKNKYQQLAEFKKLNFKSHSDLNWYYIKLGNQENVFTGCYAPEVGHPPALISMDDTIAYFEKLPLVQFELNLEKNINSGMYANVQRALNSQRLALARDLRERAFSIYPPNQVAAEESVSIYTDLVAEGYEYAKGESKGYKNIQEEMGDMQGDGWFDLAQGTTARAAFEGSAEQMTNVAYMALAGRITQVTKPLVGRAADFAKNAAGRTLTTGFRVLGQAATQRVIQFAGSVAKLSSNVAATLGKAEAGTIRYYSGRGFKFVVEEGTEEILGNTAQTVAQLASGNTPFIPDLVGMMTEIIAGGSGFDAKFDEKIDIDGIKLNKAAIKGDIQSLKPDNINALNLKTKQAALAYFWKYMVDGSYNGGFTINNEPGWNAKITESGVEFTHPINRQVHKVTDTGQFDKLGIKFDDAKYNDELKAYNEYIDGMFKSEATQGIQLKPDFDPTITADIFGTSVDARNGRIATAGIIDAVFDSSNTGYRLSQTAIEGHAMQAASLSLPLEPSVKADVLEPFEITTGSGTAQVQAGTEALIGRMKCSEVCKLPIIGKVMNRPERGEGVYKSIERVKIKDPDKLYLNDDFKAVAKIMRESGDSAISFFQGSKLDIGVYTSTNGLLSNFVHATKNNAHYLFIRVEDGQWVGAKYGGDRVIDDSAPDLRTKYKKINELQEELAQDYAKEKKEAASVQRVRHPVEIGSTITNSYQFNSMLSKALSQELSFSLASKDLKLNKGQLFYITDKGGFDFYTYSELRGSKFVFNREGRELLLDEVDIQSIVIDIDYTKAAELREKTVGEFIAVRDKIIGTNSLVYATQNGFNIISDGYVPAGIDWEETGFVSENTIAAKPLDESALKRAEARLEKQNTAESQKQIAPAFFVFDESILKADKGIKTLGGNRGSTKTIRLSDPSLKYIVVSDDYYDYVLEPILSKTSPGVLREKFGDRDWKSVIVSRSHFDVDAARNAQLTAVEQFNRRVKEAADLINPEVLQGRAADYTAAFARLRDLFRDMQELDKTQSLNPAEKFYYLSNYARAAAENNDMGIALIAYRYAMLTGRSLSIPEVQITRNEYIELIKSRYSNDVRALLYRLFSNNPANVDSAILKAIDNNFNFLTADVHDFIAISDIDAVSKFNYMISLAETAKRSNNDKLMMKGYMYAMLTKDNLGATPEFQAARAAYLEHTKNYIRNKFLGKPEEMSRLLGAFNNNPQEFSKALETAIDQDYDFYDIKIDEFIIRFKSG